MTLDITVNSLDHLIRYHRETTYHHVLQTATQGIKMRDFTVKVLMHYLAIISASPEGYRARVTGSLGNLPTTLPPPGPEEFSG